LKATLTSEKDLDTKVKGEIPQTKGGAIKTMGRVISMRQ